MALDPETIARNFPILPRQRPPYPKGWAGPPELPSPPFSSGVAPPRRGPPISPPLPSALAMPGNLASAVADHARDGFRKADDETIAARLAVCGSCEFFRPSDKRCSKCGCDMRAKAPWRSSTCPVGKW